MIETDYFILSTQEYQECAMQAENLGVNVDYFLMEFCTIDANWVEISD